MSVIFKIKKSLHPTMYHIILLSTHTHVFKSFPFSSCFFLYISNLFYLCHSLLAFFSLFISCNLHHTYCTVYSTWLVTPYLPVAFEPRPLLVYPASSFEPGPLLVYPASTFEPGPLLVYPASTFEAWPSPCLTSLYF